MRDYVEPLANHIALVIGANTLVTPTDMTPDGQKDCEGFDKLRIYARSQEDFGDFTIVVASDVQDTIPVVLDDFPLVLPAVKCPAPPAPIDIRQWVVMQTVDITGMKVVGIYIVTGDLEVRDFKLRSFLINTGGSYGSIKG